MLKVVIPASEQYNSAENLFYYSKETTLTLEHSLVSVAKWEAKWHKPFLRKEQKSYEETIDYIRCMTITQNVDPLVYNSIPPDIVNKVDDYINEPMTATTFGMDTSSPNREIITAEIIYYWMTELNIPIECQKWHLNRLLTLVRVCSIKRSPGKKMSRRQTANRYRELNQARRKKYGTKG